MVVTTEDDAVDDEAMVDNDAMDAIERRRPDDDAVGLADAFDCLRDELDDWDADEQPDDAPPAAADLDLDLARGDGDLELDDTSTTLSVLLADSVCWWDDGC